jgi:hypothetical protein
LTALNKTQFTPVDGAPLLVVRPILYLRNSSQWVASISLVLMLIACPNADAASSQSFGVWCDGFQANSAPFVPTEKAGGDAMSRPVRLAAIGQIDDPRGQGDSADVKTEVSKEESETSVSVESAKENETDENQTEEDEVCRPVIKVLVRRRENAAVAALRQDVRSGLLDEVAVDIQVVGRVKDQPKIQVPVSSDRYKVWYGYHSGIREAILRTALDYGRTLSEQDDSAPPIVEQQKENTQSATESFSDSQSDDSEAIDSGVRAGGYPTRTSWWTVGKQHPEKEGMVKHLSGGPHRDKFDLVWLGTLTREELHSLHSDDHEKKVNWQYARKPVELPSDQADDLGNSPESTAVEPAKTEAAGI